MSIRHLDSLFDPASVAVIGASETPFSIGETVWRNLRDGGFKGPRYAVNPKWQSVQGEPCVARVADLPAAPELAVLCTPVATLPGLIAELGARGTRAAIVLSAGLDPVTQQAMLDAARKHLLRILGPNCLGLLSPRSGLNASFAHIGARPGGLAFVSQSGALITAMLDWSAHSGIGYSHLVSLGEHADVDFGDLLDWLASDPHTQAILLYIESIEAPRKFLSAARAAARNKPVLVVKAGRSAQGQAAAASHTGALAGSDLVFDAAIRRAGMLRVDTLADLLVAAQTLAHFRGPLRDVDPALEQLTVITNGGGAAVMAADATALAGLQLAPLSSTNRSALDAVLPRNWSHSNPIDLIGDAPIQRYVDTVQTLLADPQSGTLLFMHAPTAVVDSAQIAAAVLPHLLSQPQRVLAAWLGGPGVAQARKLFSEAGIACFDTPEEAVDAFALLVTYRRNQAQLLQAPPARSTTQSARQPVAPIIDAVLAQGRDLLTEPEAKALLHACGIPIVQTRVVSSDTAEVLRAASEIGYPVVLKILSKDISHKSDVGGVALALVDSAALQQAATAMLERVARLRPDAKVDGFTVQQMIRRPQARELILGSSIDPLFGPVILFGAGGTSVEVVADRAIALPPLNQPLADALIARTRISALLKAWRDVPAADHGAINDVLIALSQLLADEPRIVELDINPLLADADGVIALDARVRVSAQAPGGAARFAIAAYPDELRERIQWGEHSLELRPIRPEDEAQHLAFLERLDPIDVRMRVFYSRRSIERTELARLTQIDYAREMAFIATRQLDDQREETLGVVRATTDPDNFEAEFGIVVRSDLKGAGLGERLLSKMVDYLRQRGTQWLVANVLRENRRMLELAQALGFEQQSVADEHEVLRLRLPLQQRI
jgi:acetyltransferase